MLKQTALLLFCCAFLLSPISAQSLKQQFNQLMVDGKTDKAKKLLDKWERDNSNDPELYASYFNYYVETSKGDITISNQLGKDSNLNSLNNKNVGYKQYYKLTELQKGLAWADKGIEKFPNRLDIRFGKIYMYGETGDYKNLTDEVVKVIDYSFTHSHNWLWMENKPADQQQMQNSIQRYFAQLYSAHLANKGDTVILGYMERIPATILKHDPDHTVSLSNLAVVYLIREEYNKSLELLLKAEKIDPTDLTIKQTLAQNYELLGNYKEAITTFEQLAKAGSQKQKEMAEKKIAELKAK